MPSKGDQQELPQLLVDTMDVVWSNVFAQLLSYTSVHAMIDFCHILMCDFLVFATSHKRDKTRVIYL